MKKTSACPALPGEYPSQDFIRNVENQN